MANGADTYFAVVDKLESILKADPRTANIKEYIFGEKEQALLKFPVLFILPGSDSQELTAKNISQWEYEIILCLVTYDLDLQKGKKDAVRLGWDIADILTENKTLGSLVSDVVVTDISHDTGKDNQGKVLHWETLSLTVKHGSKERR